MTKLSFIILFFVSILFGSIAYAAAVSYTHLGGQASNNV